MKLKKYLALCVFIQQSAVFGMKQRHTPGLADIVDFCSAVVFFDKNKLDRDFGCSMSTNFAYYDTDEIERLMNDFEIKSGALGQLAISVSHAGRVSINQVFSDAINKEGKIERVLRSMPNIKSSDISAYKSDLIKAWKSDEVQAKLRILPTVSNQNQ